MAAAAGRAATVALVVGCAVVATGAGCGKGGGERLRRDRDAGAGVEMVDEQRGGPMTIGDEREPDDTASQANPLAAGAGVRGTLDGEADVDLYRVTVATPGLLTAQLGGVAGVDLILELRDAGGVVLARSDRGPAKIDEGLPGFGVARGDYLLAVREFVKPRKAPAKKKKPTKPAKGAAIDAAPAPVGRQGPSEPYTLTVTLAADPPANHEREPDDELGSAGEVLMGDAVRGWIGWAGDVDVWKLSLEAFASQYALDVDVAGVDGVALTLEVLDGDGAPLVARTGVRGGPVTIKNLAPALGEGSQPWHYVRLKGDRSNPSAPYELHVSTRLLDLDEEVEPNDVATTATPLRVGALAATPGSGTIRATHAAGDVDCFVLDALTEPSQIDVTVEAPEGGDVIVEVVDDAGALLAKSDTPSVGVRERVGELAVAAGVRATVKVSVKADKKAGGESRPYTVRWSQVIAAPPPSDVAPSPDDMPPEEY